MTTSPKPPAGGGTPGTPDLARLDPDRVLRKLFGAAVAAALPQRIVPPHLPAADGRPLVVIGAGKASAAMAAAVEDSYDGPVSGLVVTRYGHGVPTKHIEIVEAAHPVPDAAGAIAAARMLDLVSGLGADDHVLALISGGGSALLTLMPDALDQDDGAKVSAELLASGAPIDQMNCLRRHLSQIAGGRLAAAAYPARMTTLMISDVPGDNPIDIASGPTVGDPSTLSDALEIVARHDLRLPDTVMEALRDPANETVKPEDPRLSKAQAHLIAAPLASLEAAQKVALDLGLQVEMLGDRIEGEAREVGAQMARQALEIQATMAPGDVPRVLLSGGETTVTLPRDDRPLGAGGRNVDFLMGLARELSDRPGIWAVAGDTDGVDGLDEIAGAVVTPTTQLRADAFGYPLSAAMAAYDGHGFFDTLNDQIVTGPTLTNVNDFRAIWIAPRS